MCEPWGICNYDQKSFKVCHYSYKQQSRNLPNYEQAYMSRFLALTAKLAPFTAEFILPKLRSSAVAAARHCSNGNDGNTCGMRWTLNGAWDNSHGVGEQLSALETIQNSIFESIPLPATQKSRGTSKGDPDAGGSRKGTKQDDKIEVTTAGRVGAAFATIALVGLLCYGSYWMIKA
jgi:mannan endo-1,6-alpha-mannosidase